MPDECRVRVRTLNGDSDDCGNLLPCRTHPPQHVCGLQGFGALGDVCEACSLHMGPKTSVEESQTTFWDHLRTND